MLEFPCVFADFLAFASDPEKVGISVCFRAFCIGNASAPDANRQQCAKTHGDSNNFWPDRNGRQAKMLESRRFLRDCHRNVMKTIGIPTFRAVSGQRALWPRRAGFFFSGWSEHLHKQRTHRRSPCAENAWAIPEGGPRIDQKTANCWNVGIPMCFC